METLPRLGVVVITRNEPAFIDAARSIINNKEDVSVVCVVNAGTELRIPKRKLWEGVKAMRAAGLRVKLLEEGAIKPPVARTLALDYLRSATDVQLVTSLDADDSVGDKCFRQLREAFMRSPTADVIVPRHIVKVFVGENMRRETITLHIPNRIPSDVLSTADSVALIGAWVSLTSVGGTFAYPVSSQFLRFPEHDEGDEWVYALCHAAKAGARFVYANATKASTYNYAQFPPKSGVHAERRAAHTAARPVTATNIFFNHP